MQLPKQGEPAHGIKIQTLGDCFSEAPGGGGGAALSTVLRGVHTRLNSDSRRNLSSAFKYRSERVRV